MEPTYSSGLALAAISVGLVWGFFFTPDDFRQGSTVKIIYLHVPSAMMAINAWAMMLVTSLVWLIRRHHVSALAAKAAAPIGITFTLIALFTGAVWGQPMWGTWWAWDPRLTSFLILFLFYLGYMALWAAIVATADESAMIASHALALGADVVAIEDRRGDTNRSMGAGPHPQLSGVSLNLLRTGPPHEPLDACLTDAAGQCGGCDRCGAL